MFSVAIIIEYSRQITVIYIYIYIHMHIKNSPKVLNAMEKTLMVKLTGNKLRKKQKLRRCIKHKQKEKVKPNEKAFLTQNKPMLIP